MSETASELAARMRDFVFTKRANPELDNDGSEWVCKGCGTEVAGPAFVAQCPKCGGPMIRKGGTPDVDEELNGADWP